MMVRAQRRHRRLVVQETRVGNRGGQPGKRTLFVSESVDTGGPQWAKARRSGVALSGAEGRPPKASVPGRHTPVFAFGGAQG